MGDLPPPQHTTPPTQPPQPLLSPHQPTAPLLLPPLPLLPELLLPTLELPSLVPSEPPLVTLMPRSHNQDSALLKPPAEPKLLESMLSAQLPNSEPVSSPPSPLLPHSEQFHDNEPHDIEALLNTFKGRDQ